MDVMLTLDKHMNQIREDAQAIYHPQFASQEDDQQHSTTSKAIEAVKEGMHELREMYQRLMSACQQKRELFIVSVQFHMNMRQVCPYMYANLEPTASTYVRMTVCTYVVHVTYMYILYTNTENGNYYNTQKINPLQKLPTHMLFGAKPPVHHTSKPSAMHL